MQYHRACRGEECDGDDAIQINHGNLAVDHLTFEGKGRLDDGEQQDARHELGHENADGVLQAKLEDWRGWCSEFRVKVVHGHHFRLRDQKGGLGQIAVSCLYQERKKKRGVLVFVHPNTIGELSPPFLQVMQLTQEQQGAAHSLQEGRNVGVQAIPGAGKTALLVHTCLISPKPCLILAYNTQLATDIKRALSEADLEADVTCCTFHSLCTRTLAPARDDVGILQAVQGVTSGVIVPRDVPEARRVLIDESQDVRELYVELLQILKLCAPHVPTMVVGDRMQLIYDFDPDFPATEETLLEPEKAFGTQGESWEKVILTQSHRLTRPMAILARSVFDIDIHSVREGCAVEVRMGSAFKWFDLLRDVLLDDPDAHKHVMLLVDKKKSNRGLCLLLNELSRHGMGLHVHGVDAEDADATRGKLRCSTWWAAKGMQTHTVVCLVPRFTPRNPLYVGLTRAFHRMIVVMNEKEPHVALCRSLLTLPREVVSMNDKSRRIAQHAVADRQDEDSFGSPPDYTNPDSCTLRLRSMEHWRAPRRVASMLRTTTATTWEEAKEKEEDGNRLEDASIVNMGGKGVEDVGPAALRCALVAVEFHRTRRVRGMEDILNPPRLDPSQYSVVVRCGLASRYVSSNRPANDVLLSRDLFDKAKSAYQTLLSTTASECGPLALQPLFATIALAIMAWDSFDHNMRQLLPVEAWCFRPTVVRAVEGALTHLPHASEGNVDYDVRSSAVHEEDTLLVVRTHATSSLANYLVVWGDDAEVTSHETLTQAGLRAAMHPQGLCIVVDIVHNWTKHVHVDLPKELFALVE